jgi:hypothetical protein
MQHDPNLLITAGFRQEAAVLRHYEKLRVSTANRLYSLTEFPKKKSWGMHLPPENMHVEFLNQVLATISDREEEQADALAAMYTDQCPLHHWTEQFKGLAPGKLMARFLGETGDPYLQVTGNTKDGKPITEPRVRSRSQFTRLCGIATVGGALEGHSAGEQSSFRDTARVRLWLIVDQLVKQHDATWHPVFLEGTEWYKQEQFRALDAKGAPWKDERLEVVAHKRARILVARGFTTGLYREARALHDPAAHKAALDDEQDALRESSGATGIWARALLKLRDSA